MTDPRDALLAVFAEQREALLRFLVRRVGSMAQAEDLTQETWIRAATAPAGPIVNPRSYLFRIATNLAHDHQRRAVPELPAGAGALSERIRDPEPSPERVTIHRLELARLIRAVDALPPRCREVFILVKVHGLSYGEAAERLGIARNTVMVQMTRALAWLDRNFEPEIGGGE